jgi:hypothetical protein
LRKELVEVKELAPLNTKLEYEIKMELDKAGKI